MRYLKSKLFNRDSTTTVRVTDHFTIIDYGTTPIVGETGNLELMAKHYNDVLNEILQHWFVLEFGWTDASKVEAYSSGWELVHSEPNTGGGNSHRLIAIPLESSII